jgi:DNA-binding ferritin-like protein
MTPEPPSDPMAALNEVLSEIIDVVMALRQAHRRVPEGHKLHAELDQLVSDAKAWAERLMEADTARGVSALAYMPSVAGRQSPNLWHGPVGDDDVRQVVGEQLARLAGHVRAALSDQGDDSVRGLLDQINAQLRSHLEALNKL